MKQLLLIFSATALLMACGKETDNSLDGKKKELEKVRKEIAQLQSKAKMLESEIDQLDTNAVIGGIAVRVDTLKYKPFKNPFQVQGLVSADDNVNLAPEVGGNIVNIRVREGQKVTKGQTLVSIDASAMSAQIDELEKALELATVTYNKQRALWEERVGTELQYLQARNNMESLQKRLESSRIQLSKFSIQSPVSGTVDALFMNAGDFAAPGMPILRIVGGKSLKIQADISEKYLRSMKVGDVVEVYYPALKLGHQEKVSAVGSYINPNNRTFATFIEPSSLLNELKPNLLAIVTAYDYEADQALSVPTKLIRNDGNSSYIMLARPEEDGSYVALRQSITIEQSFASRSIVSGGLQEGDLVITEGYQKVIQGDRLEIIP